MQAFRLRLGAIVTTVGLGACVEPPRNALVDPGDDDAASAPADATPQHITLNHITLNHITLNGLLANYEANRELPLVPLRTESFAPGATYPLLRATLATDPWARELMPYLVSCALPAGQTVGFVDNAGNTWQWGGDLGLCPAWGAQGGSANVTCQELVSACILARTNAYGQYVPLSLRGDGLGVATLAPSITSVATDQLVGGDIASTRPCGAGVSGFADCGWRLERVVTCNRGDVIQIGAGGASDTSCGPTVGESSNDTILRVSEGVRARNSGAVPSGIRPYLQWQDDDTTNGACWNLQPMIELTCNVNGVYSVMSASYDRSRINTAVVDVRGGRIGDWEAGVYRQREGAFYGNIFSPGDLAVQVYFDGANQQWRVFEYATQRDSVRSDQLGVQGTVFKDMWACSAPEWTTAAALFHARLCALGGCTATWIGACSSGGTAATAMCAFDDTRLTTGTGHGGWDDCRDGRGIVRHSPLSSFLAGQCDAVPDPALCGTINNPAALP